MMDIRNGYVVSMFELKKCGYDESIVLGRIFIKDETDPDFGNGYKISVNRCGNLVLLNGETKIVLESTNTDYKVDSAIIYYYHDDEFVVVVVKEKLNTGEV